jgi:hypothetical protein
MTDVGPATAAQPQTRAISPAPHAVLDDGVAFGLLAAGATVLRRHRAASTLALVNGGAILTLRSPTNEASCRASGPAATGRGRDSHRRRHDVGSSAEPLHRIAPGQALVSEGGHPIHP